MKRPVLVLYGLLAYLLFNASFLYLGGFLQDFAVPKAVNDGTVVSTPQALAINLSLVFLFGFFHSLMARDGFKRWWTRFVPVAAERSTYVLQSALFLFLAMWQWHPMPHEIWLMDGLLAAAMTALFGAGILILLTSTFLIDHFELFGLKQVWFANKGLPMPRTEFTQPLLYRIVRHPMQLGVLITVFATPKMTVGHLVFAAAMGLYVLIGLYFEERALLRDFGDTYRDYQKSTPMLIPRLLPVRRRKSGTAAMGTTVFAGSAGDES
jgi:protein-S-isoprenylcysteine O-methyltransferase Ste14